MPRAQPASLEAEVDSLSRLVCPVGGGPQIRLDRIALAYLELLVRKGLKSRSDGGIEVGGLIVGSEINWKAPEVSLTGFIPVEIEYRFGAAFRPSRADLALFQEAATKADDKIVGYFRSHFRDQATLREEDLQLLSGLFPASDCCFICIHASLNTPSNVDLYEVRKGNAPELLELFALRENRPVPLAEQPASAASIPPVPPAVPQAAPPAPTVAVHLDDSSAIEPVGGGLDKAQPAVHAPSKLTAAASSVVVSGSVWQTKKLVWMAAGVGATLAVATAAYTLGQRSVPTPKSIPWQPAKPAASMTGTSKIGLRVEQLGPQLEIRWNYTDRAIATAVRGMLIITDAAQSEVDPTPVPAPGDIELNSAQLRLGLYLYTPNSAKVNVLLMIYQPDGSFTGDIKEFTGREATPESYRPLPALSSTAEPTSQQPAREQASKGDSKKQLPVKAVAADPVRTESAARIVEKVASQPVPPVSTQVARAWSAPQPVTGSPILRAPTLLEPPVSPRALPNSGPQLPTLLLPPAPVPAAPQARPNLTYHATPNRFIAPQIIHQAVPAIPLGIAPRIRTEVQLEVMVSVDADGKVIGARVISSRGAAAGLLTIEALKSAQLCRFAPAQDDGRPVPSSAVLTFRFAPRPT